MIEARAHAIVRAHAEFALEGGMGIAHSEEKQSRSSVLPLPPDQRSYGTYAHEIQSYGTYAHEIQEAQDESKRATNEFAV